MAGISSLLEIGKKALFTYRTSLNIVGHNVANIDTPGYSRQEPVMETVTSPQGSLQALGSGGRISEVRRSYNKFLDLLITEESLSLGRWKAAWEALAQVDQTFNETSGRGLSSAMNEFWSAWQEVSIKPEGNSERLNLRGQGETMAYAFNRASRELKELQNYADEPMLSIISEVNSIADGIAHLNEDIVAVEVSGQNANDFRDRREQLLKQLADKVDMSYFESGDGSISVYVAGGRGLVEGTRVGGLQGVRGADGFHRVDWVGTGGERTDVTGNITGGALSGWIEVRDSIIPGYTDKLNALASALIKEVNRLHSSGVGQTPFTTLTGLEAVADSSAPMASQASELPFYSEIGDGSFQVRVYDDTGAMIGSTEVTVGTTTSLQALQSTLDGIAGISSTVTGDGSLKIDAQPGWSFHLSNDTSGLLMALGLNTMFGGSDASNMTLNDTIKTDPNRIAAGRVAPGGEIAAGNNLNALSIAGLQDARLMEGGAISMSDYYHSLVASVGMDAAGAEDNMEYQEAIVNQLNNRREEVSGVSLDEELVDLMEYANAYNASAKLITAAQDMLDILLGLVK